MEKIVCDITNCAHNKTGICFSNRVDIIGQNATDIHETLCGSFSNKSDYNSLSNSITSNTHCDYLTCTAKTCTHNSDNLCMLESINVSGSSNAQISPETVCSSFNYRS